MLHDGPITDAHAFVPGAGGVTWSHGMTHARRKRLSVGIAQACATAVVAALSFQLAFLLLNSWPASLGQVRHSPYSVLPVCIGLVRMTGTPEFRPYLPLFLIAPPTILAVFRWLGLFGFRSGAIVPFGRSGAIIRGSLASLGMISLIGLTYTIDLIGRPTEYMLIYFAMTGAILVTGLLLAYGAIGIGLLALRTMGLGLTRLALVARSDEAHHLAPLFTTPSSDYALLGYIAPDDEPGNDAVSCKRMGSLRDLAALINGDRIDEMILAVDPGSLNPEQRLQIALTCWRLGVELKMVTPFYPYFHTRGEPEIIGDTPLLSIERVGLYGRGSQLLKRGFDFVFSAILLILLTPLFALVAILIRLDSKGPAFFTQERPGLHGKVFRIIKFRSMRTDADHTLHMEAQKNLITGGKAAEYDEDGRPIYGKVASDPRVTRLGQFIRKTSIDELPQLFNVLRGEMSLVGPRPSVLYELDNYSEHHLRRLNIRPGMTGLWQVSGRSRLSFEQMVELDIKYIEEWSIWLDFKILLRTIPVVLRLDQAY